MAKLEHLETFVRDKIENQRWTHEELSESLRASYPGVKGFSVRSIERFCSDKDIHKTSRLSTEDLDGAVTGAVAQVGPTYGRKTMKGLLASQGVHVSEVRVGESLCRTCPE
jgi:hypothetical protein